MSSPGAPGPVRDLAAPEGRAGLLRRLRALADDGLVELTWTLLARGDRPALRAPAVADRRRDGRGRRGAAPAGERPAGRPLGPAPARRRCVELAAATRDRRRPDGSPAAGAARRAPRGVGDRRAGAAWPRPRGGPRAAAPAARRPAGRAPRRPAGGRGADRRPRPTALAPRPRAIAARDPTPMLLDGVTGGGKTAIYVEAIAASLAAGRPALLLVPEIALATPDRRPAAGGARRSGSRSLHSGLGEGERADEWRRIRAGDVDLVVGTRTGAAGAARRRRARDRRRGARRRLQERPHAAVPGARRGASSSAGSPGAAVVLGSATPSVETMGHARAGRYRRAVLPVAAGRHRAARRPPWTCARSSRPATAGLLSDALARGARGRSTRRTATARSS